MGRIVTFIGGLGASVGLICCFTSLLPLVLTSIGAGSLIATLYRDSILFPFVGACLTLMGLGLWIARRP
jgi:mercuric ion transport protein